MNIQLSENQVGGFILCLVLALFFFSSYLRIKDSRQNLKQGKGFRLLNRLNVVLSVPIILAVLVILLLFILSRV